VQTPPLLSPSFGSIRSRCLSNAPTPPLLLRFLAFFLLPPSAATFVPARLLRPKRCSKGSLIPLSRLRFSYKFCPLPSFPSLRVSPLQARAFGLFYCAFCQFCTHLRVLTTISPFLNVVAFFPLGPDFHFDSVILSPSPFCDAAVLTEQFLPQSFVMFSFFFFPLDCPFFQRVLIHPDI